jgi:Raf kinase inhibitor-like YbhB/YbcL family protein
MPHRLLLTGILLSLACCLSKEESVEKLTVSSIAFAPGRTIPAEHTCEGADRSPPLAWSGAPAGTKAFAIIVEDPDAPDPAKPERVFTHWVVYDIPARFEKLRAGASESLPRRAKTGENDWGEADWRGPCPSKGSHRYYHKVYALDTKLDLDRPSKRELLDAMKGHVLAEGELVGTYEQRRREAPAVP